MNFSGIAFDSPWWLALLALIPALWWLGLRSLAGLGAWRRIAVILLRSGVLALLVLAAAELQWLQASKRLTVIYLLDQSKSIAEPQRQAMLRYVNAEVTRHRHDEDRAGVIVFGREPVVEIPPYDAEVALGLQTESLVNADHTNLAGAVKLALATFPEDSARRIVIVSDGNENIGDAVAEAQAAAGTGVGIDVVPIEFAWRAEVAVERVAIPSGVRRGQPFDLRVVLNNLTEPTPEDDGRTRGKLVVSRKVDGRVEVLSQQEIELTPGKHAFNLRQHIDEPSFYTYEARFVPDDPGDDTLAENNRASAFTHVRGSGQVLVLENPDARGLHELLIERLKRENLEVSVRPSDQAFSGLGELQPFDTVVLADVPRDHFSEAQITSLAQNTQDLGGGLVMLGGANSFGAGGWANTEIEKALPVDMQIKGAKVVPHGALMLVMDTSGSMGGDKIEMSKAAATAAVKVLNDRDLIGVVGFDSNAYWVAKLGEVGNGSKVLPRIARMAAGGGTNMEPAMGMAYRALLEAKSSVKHVIALTDGQTAGSGYERLARQMRERMITTTAVAIGEDANRALMQSIANAGGGKYYFVLNLSAIPRIFMHEARRVARPLIYENERGFAPRIKYPHEMLAGISTPLPPLTGYVMTTVKQNPLVEVSIVSPVPDVPENSTILASWTYGLGRSVALTTDAGQRWASAWAEWPGYDKLFSQIVRWSMRSADDTGNLIVATDAIDGKVNVVVTAIDKDDELLNFLDLSASVIGPELDRARFDLRQTAPGRYVGSFDADEAGSYFLTIGAPGKSPLRSGVNVPYSSEFRDRRTNEALLERLASLLPSNGLSAKGPAGVMIRDPSTGGDLDALLATDTFRHDLPPVEKTRDVWPQLLWIAAGLFFADVFTRRVHVNFAWVPTSAAWVCDKFLRRQKAARPEYLERLRSLKTEVAQLLDDRRASARFEAPGDDLA
ncbi:MAG TPA: VWA domain-containing protein, partial [Pirellulales bacterium]|nr:VWA domain-containing protein [Pirellulales bacterium]